MKMIYGWLIEKENVFLQGGAKGILHIWKNLFRDN